MRKYAIKLAEAALTVAKKLFVTIWMYTFTLRI